MKRLSSHPPLVLRRLPALMALAFCTSSAWGEPAANTLPSGGSVVAGQATIGSSGNTLTVRQASDRAVVDWQTFNVGRDATVRFEQPNSSSAILNRVLESQPSQIFGRIVANGHVFLTNPSGVYFSPTASADVGALVASTHRMASSDFMAGRAVLERNGSLGAVVNAGRLEAVLGGYIALLAPEVRNEGIIIAKLGSVVLAAGETITLHIEGGRSLAGVTLTPSQIKTLVDNRHLVQAPGGLVILAAKAAEGLQAKIVNSGRIEATGLAMRGGRIVLEASERIDNQGKLDASATAEGPAGTVSMTAPVVVQAGLVLVNDAETGRGGAIAISAGTILQSASSSIEGRGVAGGGLINLQAGERIHLAGTIRADGTGHTAIGGQIDLAAPSVLLENAYLNTDGAKGGSLVVSAAPRPLPLPSAPSSPLAPGDVALIGLTQLTARGRRGEGGHLTLLGDHISLRDGTRLDASGETGGGKALVGGGWQGTGSHYQATNVTMESDARIDVSAIRTGQGGTAVLWSDVHNANSQTRAYGTILAKGGSEGGDGGRIETSGHWLDATGATVHASAPLGQGGLWLLDPTDSTINASVVSTYLTSLNGGTSVLNEVTGNIDWQSGADLDKTAGGDATLTLKATGRVMVGSNISASAGKLNLVLWADSDNSGDAGVSLTQNITISTNGGHVWMGGGSAGATWQGLAVGSGAARGSASANYNALDLRGTLNTNNGSVYIAGDTTVSFVGAEANKADVYLGWDSAFAINAGSGNVEIYGDKITADRSSSITMTGTLTIAPWGNAFDSGFTWGSTLSNSNTTQSGGANGLTISSSLGGLVLGKSGSSAPITISNAITTNGPISIYGGYINVNANLSAAGNIVLNANAGSPLSGTFDGVVVNANVSTTAGSNGDITISGRGGDTGANLTGVSIQPSASVTAGGSGSVSITGIGGASTGNDNFGVRFTGSAATVSSSSGNVTITGTGGGTGSSTNNDGILIVDGGTVRSGSGTLTLTGTAGQNTNSDSEGIAIQGGGSTNTLGHASTQTGSIVLRANSLYAAGDSTNNVLGTGTLTFESLVGSNSFSTTFDTTNWTLGSGLTGLTLGKSTNTANITMGRAVSIAGPINIYGGNLNLNANLTTTTSNKDILLKASGGITQASGVAVTTSGGNVVYWADSDGSGAGSVQMGGASASSITTGGGHVWMGGSLTNGSSATWNGLTVGDGYAMGDTASANGLYFTNASITTANGNIALYGKSATSTTAGASADGTVNGIRVSNANGASSFNSGSGTILLSGVARNSSGNNWSNGVEFSNPSAYSSLTSAATSGDAITIIGDASAVTAASFSTGMLLDKVNISATGGGNVVLTGRGGSAGTNTALRLGDAAMTVAAGAGNLVLTGDTMNLASATFTGTGAMTLQPYSTSFSGTFSTNWASLPTTLTGLTLGKSGNTSGITVANPISIAGPINVYAGRWTQSAALTASTASTVTIYASEDIILSSGSSISSAGGTIILNSDVDDSGTGGITLNGSSIASNGGHIFLGGGIAGDGSGYARGLTDYNLYNNYVIGDAAPGNMAIAIGNTSITAGGGNISLKGQASAGNGASRAKGIEIFGRNGWTNTISTTGSGTLTFDGVGYANSGGVNYGFNITNSSGAGTNTISSQNGAITIMGTAGSAGNNNSGIMLEGATGTISISSTGGAISLTGTAGSGTSAWGISSSSIVTIGGASTTGNLALNADTVSLAGSYRSTGTLTIAPRTAATTIGIAGGTGTLALTAANFSTNFVNGFSGITVGGSSAGAIDVAGSMTYNDPLTLKTGGTININSGTTLTGGSGQSAHLTLWANSGATGNGAAGSGAIYIRDGASIQTNGGDITLGGGANPLTGYAVGTTVNSGGGVSDYLGMGVYVGAGSNVLSSGGNITINGAGLPSGNAWNNIYGGVSFNGSTVNAGGGKVLVRALGQGAVHGNTQALLGSATAKLLSSNAQTDAIQVLTSYVGSSSQYQISLNYAGTIAATGGGGITLVGDSGSCTNTFCTGLWMGNGMSVLANSGPISITGYSAASASYKDMHFADSSVFFGAKAGSEVTSSSSNITFNVNSMEFTGLPTIQSSGALIIQPRTAGTSIGIAGGAGTLALPANFFSTSAVNGFSGITVGGATAGAITVGGATTFNDSTTLRSNSTIAVNGAITANENLTLTANGAISQAAALTVTGATSLTAGSANHITLDNTSNNFSGAVSVSSANNLTLRDSNAMTLGAVATNGLIDIATETANLTLTSVVSTADTSSSAVVLNAGRSASAGTTTGGELIVNGGTITTGTNGWATLYSGSVSGSTGLTTLVGSGSGRFRYNSDETTTNYTAALISGLNVIYREQPTLGVSPSAASSIYGASVSVAGVTGSISGYVNGDDATKAGLSGTASFTTTATSSSNVGAYNIAYSTGLSNSVGYAISDASGSTNEYTINKKTLTVSGLVADNKTYDGSTSATLSNWGSVSTGVGAETLVLNHGTAAFDSASAGTGKTVTASGYSLADGSNGGLASNYELAATTATTAANIESPTQAPTQAPTQTPVLPPVIPPLPVFVGAATLPPVTSLSMPTSVATSATPIPAASPTLALSTSSAVPASTVTGAVQAGSVPAVTQMQTLSTTPSASSESSTPSSTPVVKGTVVSGASLTSPDTPDGGIEAFASQAVPAGVSPSVAASARGAFAEVMTRALAQGVSPAEAMARANDAMQAELAANNVSPAGRVAGDLASGNFSSLATLAGQSAAFSAALTNALRSGASMGEAMARAQSAVEQAQSLARADASPQAGLANGNGIGAGLSSNTQGALGRLLASGLSPAQALARAKAIEAETARLASLDANSPSAGLAQGDLSALSGRESGGAFDQNLSSLLARGVPMSVAIQQAKASEAEQTRLLSQDQQRPNAQLAQAGSRLTGQTSATFDAVLAGALRRGMTPADAIAKAGQAEAVQQREPAPSSARQLATGNAEKLLTDGGATFRRVLGSALARGVPADEAVAMARRAENANTWRTSLPSNLMVRAKAAGGIRAQQTDGRSLPAWLRFDSATGTFSAKDVPEGGLPVAVQVRSANGKINETLLIGEGGVMPKPPRSL